MLDIKFIRSTPDEVVRAMKTRGMDLDLSEFLSLDERRRKILSEVEQLKSKRNTVSKEIGMMKKNGENADELVKEMGQVGDEIKKLDDDVKEIDAALRNIVLAIPNIPDKSLLLAVSRTIASSAPGASRNNLISEAKGHWDIGEKLNILDFERATKVTGTRFTFYRGLGAKLERAVISLMLDIHTTENGYEELIPPYMANKDSMTGTGQLPKFAEDMFKLEGMDYYLIPTAEVPVTNYYRDEILDEKNLPIKHCAFSPCFRAEAGSYGRDTRGIIRQHQFHKVELVKFAHPENSFEELEKLTNDAEKILQRLELPYRVITLATGDIGFSSAKTYDIEVWLPSFNTYREISSCSNFLDFQARRANIRYRDKNGKVQFVHTLNGSGLLSAVPSPLFWKIISKQTAAIIVPTALRPYMGVDVIK